MILHLSTESHYIFKNHKILHLGALTGYFTVLLSNLCSEVIAIESNNELCDLFKEKINELEIQNIEIINKDFIKGYFEGAPYDRIIIDTPISAVDNSILNQLNENLGKLIMIRKVNVNFCKAVSITKNKDSLSLVFFNILSTKKGPMPNFLNLGRSTKSLPQATG